jgi:hypothetical protein
MISPTTLNSLTPFLQFMSDVPTRIVELDDDETVCLITLPAKVEGDPSETTLPSDRRAALQEAFGATPDPSRRGGRAGPRRAPAPRAGYCQPRHARTAHGRPHPRELPERDHHRSEHGSSRSTPGARALRALPTEIGRL